MPKADRDNATIARFAKKLSPHLPEGTAGIIAKWIVELKVHFLISKPRQTKLGDYRPGTNGKAHRISVNGDLHPYGFLITTVHEFAHLGCFLKHGNKVSPHGREWKQLYVKMLKPFIDENIFPPKLTESLNLHISKPKASSCSCPILSRALAEYDGEPGEFLADLSPNDVFDFRGEPYRYVHLRRTRILCKRLSDDKQYLISSRAKVFRVQTI